jgi:phosphonate transport system substrate-binding protein
MPADPAADATDDEASARMTWATACMRWWRLAALAGLAVLCLPLAAAPDTAGPPYRLGVFPYTAPRQTIDFYGPVAAAMGAALGRAVRLESAPSFPDFSRAMDEQRYDIALVQPFDVLGTVERLGYVPVAQLAVPLVSQLYVRDDSRFRSIDDLRGTTLAMPPPQTASARLTLRALFDHRLVPGRDLQVRYFNSHDSCLQQVWAGAASACGTARPPVQVFEQRMQARLRAIHDTPSVPHVMFVAHPQRVSAAQRAVLQALLVGWRDDEAGRALLKNLGFPGFVAPRMADYDVMRKFDPLPTPVATDPALGDTLRLGVFPFLAARQLAENFGPALPRLGRAAGRPVRLRTATSFGSFIEAVERRAYDVIVLQPFDYVLAAQHGYQPLAGMTERLQGSFFVLEDSPARSMADLRGLTIAMPPADAAQSRLGLHALLAAGMKPGTDVKVDHRLTHDSCLQQVKSGQAAACVTTPLTLTMVAPSLAAGLRAVGQTGSVPGILFMAHDRLPADMRARLATEITGWKDSSEGQAVLRALRLGPMGPVVEQDYRRLTLQAGTR